MVSWPTSLLKFFDKETHGDSFPSFHSFSFQSFSSSGQYFFYISKALLINLSTPSVYATLFSSISLISPLTFPRSIALQVRSLWGICMNSSRWSWKWDRLPRLWWEKELVLHVIGWQIIGWQDIGWQDIVWQDVICFVSCCRVWFPVSVSSCKRDRGKKPRHTSRKWWSLWTLWTTRASIPKLLLNICIYIRWTTNLM